MMSKVVEEGSMLTFKGCITQQHLRSNILLSSIESKGSKWVYFYGKSTY